MGPIRLGGLGFYAWAINTVGRASSKGSTARTGSGRGQLGARPRRPMWPHVATPMTVHLSLVIEIDRDVRVCVCVCFSP